MEGKYQMSKTKARSSLRPLTVPAEIRKLLGPPPLLSTEHQKFYYAMLAHFGASVEGTDLITWLLLKDVADARVEIARYRRFKTLRISIARSREKERTLAEFGLEKKIETYENNVEKRRQEVAKSDLSDKEKESKYADYDSALDDAIDGAEADYAELVKKLRAPDTDLDFMGVFRRWLEDFERLDVILQAAEERFRAALDELDRYQRGRFSRLSEELDVIEAEASNPSAPTVRCPRPDRRGRTPSRMNPARSPLRAALPAATRALKKGGGGGGGE
ncbi:MAG: hypothetical protein GEU95_07405 [Rhizobiales bacterium]|nr:hypothetical protein [Hyphomicrobiales bacterium]